MIKDKAKSASDESEKEPYIFIRRPSRDCLHILFCFSLRNIRVLFTETPKKTIAWAWNRRGDRIRNTFQHNHHRHLSRKIHKRSSFALHSFFSVCVPVDRCTGMRSNPLTFEQRLWKTRKNADKDSVSCASQPPTHVLRSFCTCGGRRRWLLSPMNVSGKEP